MTDLERIQLTLAEFAEKHGLGEGLSLNEEGVCVLVFGGNLETAIELREGGRLSFCTTLGLPSEEHSAEIYRKCLEKHLFWEEISERFFAVDPGSGVIKLNDVLPVDAMTVEGFSAALEGQLVEAGEWLPVIAGEISVEPSSGTDRSTEGEHTLRI